MIVAAIKPRLAIAVLALLLLGACASETLSGAKMAEANQAYETGKFAEAIETYEELIALSAEDGALYYNLGNAYQQAGDVARAILNYRRALRLLPRDADVVTNLRIARAQAVDRLGLEDRDAFLSVISRGLVDETTLDEVAAATLGLWVLLGALIVVALQWGLAHRAMRFSIAAVTVLLVIGILTMTLRVADGRRNRPAVVVVTSVEVRSGPGEDYLVEFSLHAGAEVRVLDKRHGWARIALPGDLQGWVPGGAVERL